MDKSNEHPLQNYKLLDEILRKVYEKYKTYIDDDSRDDCEEMLDQGEYALALLDIVGAIEESNQKIDKESESLITEALKLMGYNSIEELDNSM